MTQVQAVPSAHGERLLTAVERLVDDAESLAALVEALKEDVTSSQRYAGEGAFLDAVARRVILSYSNRSALSGGATALPGVIPGTGTLIAMLGGSLADMTMTLKYEVEMALCLTHLYGFDIREERSRWLGYTLAAVNTYEATSGGNFFIDLAEVELEVLTKYTPRQLSKLVVTAFGKYALLSLSKGFLRAIPFVGIAISALANKLIVNSVGWRCVDALDRLRHAEGDDPRSVVDARVT